MKTRRTRCSLLIIALTLTAQLSLVSPSVQAKTAGLSVTTGTTAATKDNRNSRCRKRCAREHRLCMRGIVPPNVSRCRERLSRCLRRCR